MSSAGPAAFRSGCKRGKDQDDAKGQAQEGAGAKPEPLPELEMIPNREDASAGAKPNLAVELPPAPAPDRFALPEVPARYEDGAFSIRGLRDDMDAQLKRGAEGGIVGGCCSSSACGARMGSGCILGGPAGTRS